MIGFKRKKRPTGVAENVIEIPAGPEAPVVICFHGYYSNAYRLKFLAKDKALKRPVRWLFPNSTTKVGFFSFRRKWWSLDEKELKRIVKTGTKIDLSDLHPPGLDEAHDAARKFIDDLGVPWDHLIIGGHSQGSILAMELLLRAPRTPRAAFFLSGHPVDAASIRKYAPAHSGMPFFQSHGESDPVLPMAGAVKLEKILIKSGLQGRLMRYREGHKIPLHVRASLAAFINDLA